MESGQNKTQIVRILEAVAADEEVSSREISRFIGLRQEIVATHLIRLVRDKKLLRRRSYLTPNQGGRITGYLYRRPTTVPDLTTDPVTRDTSRMLLDELCRHNSPSGKVLTHREAESVFHHVVLGRSLASAGEALGISDKTVSAHIGNAAERLGFASSMEMKGWLFRTIWVRAVAASNLSILPKNNVAGPAVPWDIST
jgi:DNA-binding CsgD family transcriptional regulator